MDKAIKCLEKFGKVSRASIKLSSEIEDAISELQAHKAKIESLKEWAKNQQGGKIAFWSDVLEKLEELDK